MLNNIKSLTILKIVFHYANTRIKFKFVSYNKNLQHKLNLNIIDFQRFSGKYKIIDEKGIVKEYDSYKDVLIFEGEYLNGKKLKGKEYNKYGELIFEGDYLKGIKWNGKIKEYNDHYSLIYEGEYLNGKRNGNGKEYDDYSGIIFEGEFLNGQRWKGIGIEYENDKLYKYEGEYLNGKKGGKGKEYNLKEIDYELKLICIIF